MSWAYGIIKIRETEDGDFMYIPSEIYMNKDGRAWGYDSIPLEFESKQELISTFEEIIESCKKGKILDVKKDLVDPDFLPIIKEIEAGDLSHIRPIEELLKELEEDD